MIVRLHDKQKEIVSSPARFKVTRAGRRGGKSTGEIDIISYKAVQKAGNHVLYIAPTQKQARSIIWEQLKSRLAGIGKANEGRLEMEVPTLDGGVAIIYIGGWENRENYRGMKFQHITFDELDTLKDFFIGWQEIFRPALLDTAGTADFIGTPKKENPNLRRLEKVAEGDDDYAVFHFTTYDNPYVVKSEIEKMKIELDPDTFKQEVMAEYVDDISALFRYDALVDMFSNTVDEGLRYLIVDIADDGSDETTFTYWKGLLAYKVDKRKGLRTEAIITEIRNIAEKEKIPYSRIAVDAIGVGAGVASSTQLDGIVGFKGSYSAIKTEQSIVDLPNVKIVQPRLVSEYKNLRCQCMFELARVVNNRSIAIHTDDVKIKEYIIEELSVYQDVSKGDGKAFVTQKEDVKAIIGRSPDLSDTLQMRMYFEIMAKMDGSQSPATIALQGIQKMQMRQIRNNQLGNSAE